MLTSLPASFAGVFLLVPLLLKCGWFNKAVEILSFNKKTKVKVQNFILTLVTMFASGIKRIWHLDNIADIGFGLLTGMFRVLKSATILKLSLLIDKDKIEQFEESTREIPVCQSDDVPANISIDEHVIPEWTNEIKRKKTKVPTRGRFMKAIKAIYSFNLDSNRFISLTDKGGHGVLSTPLPGIIDKLKQTILGKLKLYFDRGGYDGALFKDLIEDDAIVSFITLARGYPTSKRQWEAIPAEEFKSLKGLPLVSRKYSEGNWVYAESKTKIRNCPYPIRSVVLKDLDAKDEKKKWHVLFTKDNYTHPLCIMNQYSVHWRHENGYKVLKGDLFVDNMPKGYVIEKSNGVKTAVNRPERTLLLGWLKGLTFNLIKDFAELLGDKYRKCTAGTIIRLFLRRPGYIKIKDDKLIVNLLPFKEQDALVPYIDNINQQNIRIPWLNELVLKFELGDITSFHYGNINRFRTLVKRNCCAREGSI